MYLKKLKNTICKRIHTYIRHIKSLIAQRINIVLYFHTEFNTYLTTNLLIFY